MKNSKKKIVLYNHLSEINFNKNSKWEESVPRVLPNYLKKIFELIFAFIPYAVVFKLVQSLQRLDKSGHATGVCVK